MAVPQFIPLAVWRNGQIKVQLSPLISNSLERTYLSADMAVGTAMTVKSQKGFHATTNQPLIIGELGGEITELVETTTSSAPTTITLNTASIFAHDAGTPVYLIKFDQIEFSHAATLAGSKVALTLPVASPGIYSIQPDKPEFILDETEFTSGFYFVRFKESVGGTFSDYSDGIEVGTWERNTVGYMIDRALNNLQLELSDNVTLWDCYEWINNGMALIQGKLKRWAEHYSYNAVLGQTSRGINTLTMPTDAYDTETNKSLIAIRIGDEKKLTYLDPPFFDAQLGNLKTTQVTTQAEINDTTFEIDNSYDFLDAGTVNVYISGTKYNISYTGVTRSATAGVLTGVPASGDGSITVQIPVDTNVWADEIEGIPKVFTVRNGKIEWYPLTDANEDNQNIYGDYAKVATIVDTDRDTIDYQRFDMLQSYLSFRIKMKAKNNGELDFTDGYFLEYREKLNDAIRTMAQNNKFRQRPTLNCMSKRGNARRADLQRLPIELQ